MKQHQHSQIIEKELGITGDYQYQALRKGNFLQSNWHANKLEIVKYLLKKYQPKSVLDLGAGSGNLELKFAHLVKKITAIDYNDEAVSFLKNKLKEFYCCLLFIISLLFLVIIFFITVSPLMNCILF